MVVKDIFKWIVILVLGVLLAIIIRVNINVVTKKIEQKSSSHIDRVLAPEEYEIWVIDDCEYVAYKNEDGRYTLTLKGESYFSRINRGEY